VGLGLKPKEKKKEKIIPKEVEEEEVKI